MTAPTLSPVRWWRDDATRYVTRGPQIVPSTPAAAWTFELLRPPEPIDSGLLRALAELTDPMRLVADVAIDEYRQRLGLPPL